MDRTTIFEIVLKTGAVQRARGTGDREQRGPLAIQVVSGRRPWPYDGSCGDAWQIESSVTAADGFGEDPLQLCRRFVALGLRRRHQGAHVEQQISTPEILGLVSR